MSVVPQPLSVNEMSDSEIAKEVRSQVDKVLNGGGKVVSLLLYKTPMLHRFCGLYGSNYDRRLIFKEVRK